MGEKPNLPGPVGGRAHPGSRMRGGHGVYVNECRGLQVPPLPGLHVGGLLPKAKLSKDQGRGQDAFLLLIISLVIKLR